MVGRFHAGEELPRCWLDPNDQRLNDLTKTDRAKADSDHQGPGAGAVDFLEGSVQGHEQD